MGSRARRAGRRRPGGRHGRDQPERSESRPVVDRGPQARDPRLARGHARPARPDAGRTRPEARGAARRGRDRDLRRPRRRDPHRGVVLRARASWRRSARHGRPQPIPREKPASARQLPPGRRPHANGWRARSACSLRSGSGSAAASGAASSGGAGCRATTWSPAIASRSRASSPGPSTSPRRTPRRASSSRRRSDARSDARRSFRCPVSPSRRCSASGARRCCSTASGRYPHAFSRRASRSRYADLERALEHALAE